MMFIMATTIHIINITQDNNKCMLGCDAKTKDEALAKVISLWDPFCWKPEQQSEFRSQSSSTHQ